MENVLMVILNLNIINLTKELDSFGYPFYIFNDKNIIFVIKIIN